MREPPGACITPSRRTMAAAMSLLMSGFLADHHVRLSSTTDGKRGNRHAGEQNGDGGNQVIQTGLGSGFQNGVRC
ncbi:hypothetical protein CSC75_09610 [Pseudoxanthomonas wuyuanensis]|nr:hypothetical protein CSC75_09610 [Pseudoxanthomonas wuyuanensis]